MKTPGPLLTAVQIYSWTLGFIVIYYVSGWKGVAITGILMLLTLVFEEVIHRWSLGVCARPPCPLGHTKAPNSF